jgi:hypothetical protein
MSKRKRTKVLPTIHSEKSTYAFGLDDVPEGFEVGSATWEEQGEIGLPDCSEADELGRLVNVETGEEIEADSIRLIALRKDARLVATWDEGRWWTPYESQRYVQELVKGQS